MLNDNSEQMCSLSHTHTDTILRQISPNLHHYECKKTSALPSSFFLTLIMNSPFHLCSHPKIYILIFKKILCFIASPYSTGEKNPRSLVFIAQKNSLN